MISFRFRQGLLLAVCLSGVLLMWTSCPFLVRETSAQARVFYIDPRGEDNNDGFSPERPWRTLKRAAGSGLKPGDTVLLRCGGVWHEPLIVPASGAQGKPLRFSHYGDGPKPRIDCTRNIEVRQVNQQQLADGIQLGLTERGTNQLFMNDQRLNDTKTKPLRPKDYSIYSGIAQIRPDLLPVSSGLRLSAAVYGSALLCEGKTDIVVENLEISGSRGTPGVVSIRDSKRIAVRGCAIHSSRGFGVALASATNIVIEGCEVHDCGLTGIGTSGDGSPSCQVQVRNNRIYRIGWLGMDRFNDGHGIGVGNLPGCSDWLIEGNDIFECGRGGGDEYADGGCGPAITMWETRGIVIRRNRIHDNYRGGITLELGGKSPGNNHEVSYNLIYRNGRNRSGKRPSGMGWSGIGVYKFVSALPVDNIRIVNNVVSDNYLGFSRACSSGIYLTVAGHRPMTNVLVANNIVHNNGDTNYEFWRRSPGVKVTMQSNLFYRPGSKVMVRDVKNEFYDRNYQQFVDIACKNCITGEPGFVDSKNGNFRLRDNSRCRERGVVVPGIHDAPAAADTYGNLLSLSNRPSCGVYR